VQASAGNDDDAEAALPGGGADWRDFRARLVASEARSVVNGGSPTSGDSKGSAARWAHSLGVLETGSVLVSSEKVLHASKPRLSRPYVRSKFAFSTQPYFYRSVIFIFEHTPQCALFILHAFFVLSHSD